jgi:hypothetical protein
VITRRAALAALMLVATGCVHYPSVMDVGGVRLVDATGAPLARYEVPGAATVR